MTQFFTTQQAGVAAILLAIALILNAFARLVMAGGQHIGPIGTAIANAINAVPNAINAWTRRTIEERDCAPKLAAALKQIEGLLVRVRDLELAIEAAGHGELTTHIVEARDDEPTGDQRLPAGVPRMTPRRRNTP
jgi:hypothetical protein